MAFTSALSATGALLCIRFTSMHPLSSASLDCPLRSHDLRNGTWGPCSDPTRIGALEVTPHLKTRAAAPPQSTPPLDHRPLPIRTSPPSASHTPDHCPQIAWWLDIFFPHDNLTQRVHFIGGGPVRDPCYLYAKELLVTVAPSCAFPSGQQVSFVRPQEHEVLGMTADCTMNRYPPPFAPSDRWLAPTPRPHQLCGGVTGGP